jgi:hypothetical protein
MIRKHVIPLFTGIDLKPSLFACLSTLDSSFDVKIMKANENENILF